jgi:pimeloyl-ACP methyl ester carboxylesterase
MTLGHVRAGTGHRPLVLLHGLLGSARNLATLARLLAERRPDLDLVAFDLPGHGASPPLPPGADTVALATEVLAAARALDLRPPLGLVGHSLGGRVALRAAALEPAAIGAVTLLDMAPGVLAAGGEVARVLDVLKEAPDTFDARGRAREHLLGAGLAPALTDWLLLNLGVTDDGRAGWRVDRHALADLHARVAAEDLWPIVESPRDWTLHCVRGALGYVSDADVRRLEAAGGAVTTIAGAGHFLHAERPHEVAEAVALGL